MAGASGSRNQTFQVQDTNGVTPDLFVDGIANTAGTRADICVPLAANSACIGVCQETIADTKWAEVANEPGDVVWVDGDGTAAPGDYVTNAIGGEATPIAASATPVWYWVHGRVMEVNLTDDKLKVKLNQFRYYI